MRLLRVALVLVLLILPAAIWLSSPLVIDTVTVSEYSAEIADRSGKPLRWFITSDGYWRFPLSIEKLDPQYIQALLAIEDQRFYTHLGVDLAAILRATAQLIYHGKIVSGASTITMQTVRLLHPRKRSWLNKLLEMSEAIRLEQTLTKNDILALYLTLTPYGGNIQGIQAASRLYFGKDAIHLMPSEIALLISLPQSPEARRPDRHPESARLARNRVLDRLLDAKQLDFASVSIAKQLPVPDKRVPAPMLAAHLTERLHARQQQQQVMTSIDYDIQLSMEQLARQIQHQLEDKTTLAMMVVDNHSHQLIASIGSGSYFDATQIDMTTAIRSPGSTLKPFIYGLGFEKKIMHPETKVKDSRIRYGNYQPDNFDNKRYGEVNLRQALLKSMNTTAVAALNQIGPVQFVSRIQQMGVNLVLPSHETPGLSIALGGVGIRLYDLVAMYSTFANRGLYYPLTYQLDEQPVTAKVLLSESAVWYINDILKDAYSPKGFSKPKDLHYKTGTSYGYRDAWSIGYTHHYTIGIWVGRPDGGYGKHITGIQTAAPILFKAVQRLPKKSSQLNVKPPAEVLITEHKSLPPALQWLGHADANIDSKPEIIYPPNNASISVFLSMNKSQAIPLKANGGTPPYHWLIDGHPLPENNRNTPMQWIPEYPGEANVTLIDQKGRISTVDVWLQ